jgi:hypothetical protein
MKVLFRVLIILVVASLIGGAIYAAVNVSGTGNRKNSFQQREGNGQFNPNGGFRPEGDREGGRGGVLGFGFGLVKNLAVISAFALIYLNWTRWFGKANKKIEV